MQLVVNFSQCGRGEKSSLKLLRLYTRGYKDFKLK